jgi:hypothetical protein
MFRRNDRLSTTDRRRGRHNSQPSAARTLLIRAPVSLNSACSPAAHTTKGKPERNKRAMSTEKGYTRLCVPSKHTCSGYIESTLTGNETSASGPRPRAAAARLAGAAPFSSARWARSVVPSWFILA